MQTIKKYFTDPLFAPIFTLCVGSVCANIVFVFFPQTVPWLSDEGQIIDIVTFGAYGLLFLSLLALLRTFREDRKWADYCIYFFLAIAATAREAGIQHWLASKDSTAIKVRFFTNPENPLSEKVLAATLVALVVITAGGILCKHARYFIPGFFRMDTISWSVVSLGLCGVLGKCIDRIPRSPVGVFLEMSETVSQNMELVEEISEVFLPFISVIILWQYYLLRKQDVAKKEKQTVSA